jgi:glycosyltransferase involved in cell wall biosynthesis
MAARIPKVSICLPNLNNRPFLQERLDTIFQQTITDWELVIVDNFSDDGAWKFFQEQAARDQRIHISQAPREGLYANWNNCIRAARGEYIYIATSDDTMTADCLEKMVNALEQNPECSIAHCCLDFIDEHGAKISSGHCWDNWPTTRFFGDWNKKYHVRPCGHDTIVALAFKTVYYSITQILARRSLFDEVGLFETKWGSFGDLEWQMRAALATKTVHVPEYLATWRIHPQQASQVERYFKAIRDGDVFDMADKVIKYSQAQKIPIHGGLPGRLRRFFWEESLNVRLAAEQSFFCKIQVLFKSFGSRPELIWPFAKNQFTTRVLGRQVDIEQEVRKELNRLGLNALVMAK